MEALTVNRAMIAIAIAGGVALTVLLTSCGDDPPAPGRAAPTTSVADHPRRDPLADHDTDRGRMNLARMAIADCEVVCPRAFTVYTDGSWAYVSAAQADGPTAGELDPSDLAFLQEGIASTDYAALRAAFGDSACGGDDLEVVFEFATADGIESVRRCGRGAGESPLLAQLESLMLDAV